MKKLWLVVRIVLTLALLSAAAYFVDWAEFLRVVRPHFFDWHFYLFLACAVLCSFFVFVFSSGALKRISDKYEAGVSRKDAMRIFFKTFAVSCILPGRTGDLTAIYYLKKKGVSIEKAMAVFITERLAYFALLFVFACVGVAAYFRDSITLLDAGLVLAIVLFSSFVAFVWGAKLLDFVVLTFFHATLDTRASIVDFFKDKKLLLSVTFFNAFRWASRVCIFYYLFTAFGVAVPFGIVFLFCSIEVFLTVLPITFGGLGPKELFAVWAYPQIYAVTPEVVMAVYLCAAVIAWIEAGIVALFLGVER